MSAYSDAWQALETHHAGTQHVTLRERFAADAERFNNMHEILHGLLFDYSKNRLDENTLDLLCQLAEAADLPQYMQAMNSGEKINTSEHRAVLHTALRLPANAKPVYVDGENIVPNVHHELNRAFEFARQLLDGTHAGITGKAITDLVHIGIGGSDLGPRMATQALQPYWQNIRVHFVSNSDDADLAQTLLGLNPETT
ncbi:glucose-6-phosphate isomerase, partial [Neisseria sp. P0021.S006]